MSRVERAGATLITFVLAGTGMVLNDWPDDLSPSDWTFLDWIGAAVNVTAFVALVTMIGVASWNWFRRR